MSIVHVNVPLVLVSKSLILNKQNNDKVKNLIAYTALFADAFLAVYVYLLNMRPLWQI